MRLPGQYLLMRTLLGLIAVDSGLVRDEQELHSDRIKLWDEFNTCWLAVLQKQKDMTQAMLASGQPPRHPQSILQEDFMERMGRELVRLCDSMERHGLVDYQMGVWEEEIINGMSAYISLHHLKTVTAGADHLQFLQNV